MLVSGSLNGWPTVFRFFKTSESTINKSTAKSWNKNNLQKFEPSASSLVVDPFGLLCLKSSFFCPCQLFLFLLQNKTANPSKLQGSSMDSASATRRPSKWLQKWRPGNSLRKFRNRKPNVFNTGWLICKGTQQKYTKLAWLFKGQKNYPPGLGNLGYMCGPMVSWCHHVRDVHIMSK